ncbi:hypothetical protein CYMTET_35808, partial [Cymbomonas tetramitiformis]
MSATNEQLEHDLASANERLACEEMKVKAMDGSRLISQDVARFMRPTRGEGGRASMSPPPGGSMSRSRSPQQSVGGSSEFRIRQSFDGRQDAIGCLSEHLDAKVREHAEMKGRLGAAEARLRQKDAALETLRMELNMVKFGSREDDGLTLSGGWSSPLDPVMGTPGPSARSPVSRSWPMASPGQLGSEEDERVQEILSSLSQEEGGRQDRHTDIVGRGTPGVSIPSGKSKSRVKGLSLDDHDVQRPTAVMKGGSKRLDALAMSERRRAAAEAARDVALAQAATSAQSREGILRNCVTLCNRLRKLTAMTDTFWSWRCAASAQLRESAALRETQLRHELHQNSKAHGARGAAIEGLVERVEEREEGLLMVAAMATWRLEAHHQRAVRQQWAELARVLLRGKHQQVAALRSNLLHKYSEKQLDSNHLIMRRRLASTFNYW